MDLPVNQFKRALREGRMIYGAWLVSGAASAAEALGCAGYDFLVVDTEHTPIETTQAAEIMRTIAGTGASAIVRPAWNDMVLVKRMLDSGAQTLLLPFVQNAEEARRAVAFTRYPPEGVRGIAGVHRGSRYGTIPNYLKNAASELCVIVQVETPTALANLAEIAAVPGVDSIFVGPGDMSASMGFLGDMANPAVLDVLKKAAQQCRKLGKPVGIVGPTPEMTLKYVEFGYTWVAIASDLGMMVGRATEWLGKLKEGTPAASKVAGGQ
jgi:4-hydroxy-2-oxoheptanedioate aldolase